MPPINYDVFISYNQADRDWVDAKLLPLLEVAGLRVAVDYRDFIVGMSRLENIERAVESSRRTIVILTPAWLADDWNLFEALLIGSADPAARQRKLLPVLLKPCDMLPPRLAHLDKVDLTAERYLDRQLQRLVRDIEDVIPVPFPPKEGGLRDFAKWRRWVRHYRRQIHSRAILIVVIWLVMAMIWGQPPFRRRPVWVAEPSQQFSGATILHNSGAALVVGSDNEKPQNCLPPKGLWYRPLEPGATWRESEVGDLLCLDRWDDTSALSAIVGLASLPADPRTIYALTSHSGLLVSADGGATFERHPASETLPPLEALDRPPLFAVSSQAAPIFWVTSENNGLLVYRDGDWRRLDGPVEAGCAGLPGLGRYLSALLVADRWVLIGADGRGLWASDDAGRTCRQVFDPAGRYEFRGLWNASSTGQARYLALVKNWRAGAGNAESWQLLDLCPRATLCSPNEWQAEAQPVWQDNTFWQSGVADVLVQPDGQGGYEWYLITNVGQIWQGALKTGLVQPLPGLNRCFAAMFYRFGCGADFTPTGPGRYPYLLADDHLYQYQEGTWWRYWWP